MTWPNVMVTRYLRETEQASPELDARARSFVNEGYQLLLTFESSSQPGGFNWWGDSDPGNVVLTAAGLQILEDMDGIVSVDREVMARVHRWMEQHQDPDGSWEFQSQAHSDIDHLTKDRLRATAYVAWALADTGYQGRALDRALDYVRARLDAEEDLYTLGLVANALVSATPRAVDLVALLARLRETRPRLLVVYLTGMDPDEPRQFTYRLVAETPLRAEVPRARVYSYYNPEVEAFAPPVELVVE